MSSNGLTQSPFSRLSRLISAVGKDVVIPVGSSSTADRSCHIRHGIDWLAHAQDMSGDGGIPIRYSFKHGWEPSYPETTGYIIPTVMNYFHAVGDERYKTRALKMADWLLSVQKDDGSIKGGDVTSKGKSIVFDTGQVIFGFLSAFRNSGQEKYLRAAMKAGSWLCAVQSERGAWDRHTYNSIPHTYDSRVAWSLLELYRITQTDSYLIASRKNLEWALSNQRPNGWFESSGFSAENNAEPFTHFIAYSIEGILEGGILLGEERYVSAAKRAADALWGLVAKNGLLRGTYDASWRSTARYSCLTGNAQMAIVFLRLCTITGETRYRDMAVIINSTLRGLQRINSRWREIRGALAGSWPIWGKYQPLCFPNWATKFLVDALMREVSKPPSPESG